MSVGVKGLLVYVMSFVVGGGMIAVGMCAVKLLSSATLNQVPL